MAVTSTNEEHRLIEILNGALDVAQDKSNFDMFGLQFDDIVAAVRTRQTPFGSETKTTELFIESMAFTIEYSWITKSFVPASRIQDKGNNLFIVGDGLLSCSGSKPVKLAKFIMGAAKSEDTTDYNKFRQAWIDEIVRKTKSGIKKNIVAATKLLVVNPDGNHHVLRSSYESQWEGKDPEWQNLGSGYRSVEFANLAAKLYSQDDVDKVLKIVDDHIGEHVDKPPLTHRSLVMSTFMADYVALKYVLSEQNQYHHVDMHGNYWSKGLDWSLWSAIHFAPKSVTLGSDPEDDEIQDVEEMVEYVKRNLSIETIHQFFESKQVVPTYDVGYERFSPKMQASYALQEQLTKRLNLTK